jgi:LacI family transcriptional regulator
LRKSLVRDSVHSKPMTTNRSRSQRNAPTIADVARHAGLSPMTVSRVINGEASVRPQTRELVKASIAALNYAPSQAARQLAGGEDLRIALVHSNPSAAYLSEFLMGSLEGASALNVQLAVEKFSDENTICAILDPIARGRVGGILLPPPLCENDVLLGALASAQVAVVAVAAGVPRADIASVRIDDFHAAKAMTDHLLALGHRTIGFIRGNRDQSASHQRYLGYIAALDEAGIAPDPAIIAQGLFTYRSGLDAANAILDAPQRPSAIFASNDDMAAATLAVAHARGLDVPSDLSVCGFDDTPMATTIWPELTTVRQPIAAMARQATETLVRMMRSKQGPAPITHTIMDYTLIERQSTAASSANLRPPNIRGR